MVSFLDFLVEESLEFGPESLKFWGLFFRELFNENIDSLCIFGVPIFLALGFKPLEFVFGLIGLFVLSHLT